MIGYWSGGTSQDAGLPSPQQFVDPDWDAEDRRLVADYLRRGFVHRAYMGWSPCRMCDRRDNGNLELSDGAYIWPEGLVHYVEDHAVRPPEVLTTHVLSELDRFETLPRDETWWRSFTP